MNTIETHFFSFVIKIWLEETATESSSATWRGRITHVPSGDEYYFNDLSSVVTIIKPYLSEVGADTEQSRLRRWWRRYR